MIKYKDLPVNKNKTFKLTVTMDVKASQAYALIEMFEYWKFCGDIGISRNVGFFVDGDGDFHPKCEIKTEIDLPEIPQEQKDLAVVANDNGNCLYDFDPIVWSLDE